MFFSDKIVIKTKNVFGFRLAFSCRSCLQIFIGYTKP